MRRVLIVLCVLLGQAPALAQTADDEVKVRAIIADWYRRIGHAKADAPWALLAPGAIDGGPGHAGPADLDGPTAAIGGPRINHELAARALQFRYDIDVLKLDARLAKAIV